MVDVRVANIFEEEADFLPRNFSTGVRIQQLEEGVASAAGGYVAVPTLLLQLGNDGSDSAFVHLREYELRFRQSRTGRRMIPRENGIGR